VHPNASFRVGFRYSRKMRHAGRRSSKRRALSASDGGVGSQPSPIAACAYRVFRQGSLSIRKELRSFDLIKCRVEYPDFCVDGPTIQLLQFIRRLHMPTRRPAPFGRHQICFPAVPLRILRKTHDEKVHPCHGCLPCRRGHPRPRHRLQG
jgi:hypothetical protein